MSEYPYIEAVNDFPKLFDKALASRIPFRIKNPEGKSVVILSEEDYESLEETSYLTQNSFNAEHITKAVNEKSYKYENLKAFKESGTPVSLIY